MIVERYLGKTELERSDGNIFVITWNLLNGNPRLGLWNFQNISGEKITEEPMRKLTLDLLSRVNIGNG